MALIKCPECSKDISSLASACPGCGCPNSAFPSPQTKPDKSLARELTASSSSRVAAELLPVPEAWEETNSPSEIKSIKGGAMEGCTREGKWYRSPRHSKLIEPTRDLVRAPSFLIDRILDGRAAGYWRRREPGSQSGSWFVKRDTFLLFSHPALGADKVVRVPGTGSWLAAFFPWLWHIVNWTPRGLWLWGLVWVLGHFSLEYIRITEYTSYGSPDEGSGAILFLETLLFLVVFITYFLRASYWLVEHLERRGFRLKTAIEARSKDEARAKFVSGQLR